MFDSWWHHFLSNRNVAQLVAHYVRDVGVGRSSRLIPTKIKGNFLEYSKLPFISIQSPEQIQDGYVIKHNLLYHEKQDLSLYSSSSFFYVHQLHKNSNYPFRE